MNEDQQISLSHFILDVYRYILNECSDNTVGNATYEEWCPRAEGAVQNSQRPFVKGPDVTAVRKTHRIYRPESNGSASDAPDDGESPCVDSSHDTAANTTNNSVQQSVTQISVTQIGNGIQIAEVSGGTFNFNLGRS